MNPKVKRILKRILASGLPDNMCSRFMYRGAHGLGVVARESGQWLFKVFVVEPTVRSICSRVGTHLRIERIPYIRGPGSIEIGDNVYVSGLLCVGFSMKSDTRPLLQIGSRTFIGHNSAFSVVQKIELGEDCLIAGDVRFYDNDGHPVDPEARRRHEPAGPSSSKPIVIANNVWIGTGSIILKGVSIGEGSIVGAGSVVTKSIPSYSIAVGNPARVVRSITSTTRTVTP
jgi:acetyltransferase-like isoleucine patch superfamily enzyme